MIAVARIDFMRRFWLANEVSSLWRSTSPAELIRDGMRSAPSDDTLACDASSKMASHATSRPPAHNKRCLVGQPRSSLYLCHPVPALAPAVARRWAAYPNWTSAPGAGPMRAAGVRPRNAAAPKSTRGRYRPGSPRRWLPTARFLVYST